jgi:hypothetical protein
VDAQGACFQDCRCFVIFFPSFSERREAEEKRREEKRREEESREEKGRGMRRIEEKNSVTDHMLGRGRR